MRKIRMVGAALTAVLALAAMAVTASASAHVFKASTTGTLSGKTESAQTFNDSIGAWECSGASVSGSVNALEASTLKTKVGYETCFWFGYVDLKPAQVEYEWNANGTVSLLATAKFVFGGCEIKFPSTGNQELKTVGYSNTSSGVEAKPGISGMTYETKGCTANGLYHNGTMTGLLPFDLVGGTLSWT